MRPLLCVLMFEQGYSFMGFFGPALRKLSAEALTDS
jgi:hypothetical protein